MSEEKDYSRGVLFDELEIPDTKKIEGKIRVTVEVDEEIGQKTLAAMSSDFSDIGFEVDDILGQGPKPKSARTMAPDSEQQKNTIVVSGWISEDKINDLKSDPHVKDVSIRERGHGGFFSNNCP